MVLKGVYLRRYHPYINLIYDNGLTRGPTGPAINLQIGTVTTGNPGTNAAATINSLGNNTYSLDLTIPQGPTGPAA